MTGIMKAKEIKKLIEEYIGFTLKQDDENRINSGVSCSAYDTEDGTVYVTDRADFDPDVEAISEELAENKYNIVSRLLDEFLQSKGVEIDKESYEYRLLCRDIAHAHIDEIHQINVDRDMGVFTDPYYLKADTQDVPEVSPVAPAQEVSGPLLSELTAKYLAEKQAKESCGKGTIEANQRYFDLFLEILGDIPVQIITRDQLVDCLNKMKMIPSRREMMPEYKGKSIKELLELESVAKPLGVQTIKNHMSTLSSCFKWAMLNGHMTTNIAEGLIPKDKRGKREKRQPYTKEHLQSLADNLYTRHKAQGKSPDRWLIPLVALYAGMRIEEICHLQKKDVKQIDGVWCFDVYQEGENSVKTPNSERIVPVHPKLIELGFLEYHRSINHEQLWPRLKRINGKLSHKWGQWFQSFNKRYVTKDGRFVFHSFRHGFADGLKQQGIQEQIIAEMVGHSRGSITMETYAKEYGPKLLLEALMKLDYGVDFSFLNWTKECES